MSMEIISILKWKSRNKKHFKIQDLVCVIDVLPISKIDPKFKGEIWICEELNKSHTSYILKN